MARLLRWLLALYSMTLFYFMSILRSQHIDIFFPTEYRGGISSFGEIGGSFAVAQFLEAVVAFDSVILRRLKLACRPRLLPPPRGLLSRRSPRLSRLFGVAPHLLLRLPLLLPAFVPSVLVLFAILPT